MAVAAAVFLVAAIWLYATARVLARLLTTRLDEGSQLRRTLRSLDHDMAALIEEDVEGWLSATRQSLPSDLRARFDLAAPWPIEVPRAADRIERALDQGMRCLGTFLTETGRG
jgi:hypothetical protein